MKMKKRQKPGDFKSVRDLLQYLTTDEKCGDPGCQECRVIDWEEAVYFITEFVKNSQPDKTEQLWAIEIYLKESDYWTLLMNTNENDQFGRYRPAVFFEKYEAELAAKFCDHQTRMVPYGRA